MKIDKIDKKLLYCLNKDARLPYTKLGDYVNRSKETARYRVNKLEEHRYITDYVAWIDPTKLGYRPYKIYLTIRHEPQRKQALIQEIKDHSKIFWLGVADGAWDIGITFFAKQDTVFYNFEQTILARYSDIILDQNTGILIDAHVQSNQFLHDGDISTHTLFQNREQITLDKAAKIIARQLYQDATRSLVDLASDTNLSVEGVRQKLHRLEDQGVINRHGTRLDLEKLGYDFYKTFIYTQTFTDQEFKRLKTAIRKHPNIVHYVRQISPWSIELETVAKSFKQYNSILRDLKQNFSETITNMETAVMYEDHIFPAKEPLIE